MAAHACIYVCFEKELYKQGNIKHQVQGACQKWVYIHVQDKKAFIAGEVMHVCVISLYVCLY